MAEDDKKTEKKKKKKLGAPKGKPHKYPANRKSTPPKSTSFGQLINMEPGDNARFTKNALEVMLLPPIDRDDPVAVENRVREYFEIVIRNDMKPSVAGLANALGMHRSALIQWVNGTYRVGQPQVDVVKKAYAFLNQLWEDYMQNGKINPVSGIFLGKNNFGYADRQELDITAKPDSVREGRTDAELRALYDLPIEAESSVIE